MRLVVYCSSYSKMSLSVVYLTGVCCLFMRGKGLLSVVAAAVEGA